MSWLINSLPEPPGQYIVRSCLFKIHFAKKKRKKIHFANFCLLIGEFNPFTFKVITDNEELFSPAIVLFVFYMSHLFFLNSSNTVFICV